MSSKCFSPVRYLLGPLRLLPAGATVAGRGSHPLGHSAFPRRTSKPGLFDYTGYAVATADPTSTPDYETVALNLDGSFSDEDGVDKDESGNLHLRYTIANKPDELVIDTVNGFVAVNGMSEPILDNAPFMMKAVLLQPIMEPFDIKLYAHDLDNDKSNQEVTLKFTGSTHLPQKGLYNVKQDDKGKFGSSRVGNRLGVQHGLKLFKFDGTTDAALITDAMSELVTARRLASADTTTTACSSEEPRIWATTKGFDGLGDSCYTVGFGRGVEGSIDENLTEVDFTLSTKQPPSRARITISYHVWAYSRGILVGESFPADADQYDSSRVKGTAETYTKYIDLVIHKCGSTADCPLGAE